jgi:hypothetical protein
MTGRAAGLAAAAVAAGVAALPVSAATRAVVKVAPFATVDRSYPALRGYEPVEQAGGFATRPADCAPAAVSWCDTIPFDVPAASAYTFHVRVSWPHGQAQCSSAGCYPGDQLDLFLWRETAQGPVLVSEDRNELSPQSLPAAANAVTRFDLVVVNVGATTRPNIGYSVRWAPDRGERPPTAAPSAAVRRTVVVRRPAPPQRPGRGGRPSAAAAAPVGGPGLAVGAISGRAAAAGGRGDAGSRETLIVALAAAAPLALLAGWLRVAYTRRRQP